jgi:VIT1/CCC1 family predicted Fe2+/Mn2+ transporter
MYLMRHLKRIAPDYIHSIFFGIEDSLVSTTGALAGIAISSGSKELILATALVIIAVESTSMGASEFLSEETEEDIEKEKMPANPKVSGLILFLSYGISGLIPLIPYLVLTGWAAIITSITAALFGMIILGIVKGKLSKKSPFRSALEVLIIGGIASGIGIAAGLIFKV